MALANIALDLLGQARLLLARAGGPRPTAGRGRAGLLPRRRRVPQRPAGRAPGRRLRRAGRPAARRRHLAAGAVRPAARLARPGARRDRRQGRQRADLPPRLRRRWVLRLGDGTDGSHRRDAGRARRGLAAARRAVRRPGGGRLPAVAAARRPARRGRRRARRGARRGHAATARRRARSAGSAGAAGRDGVHTERSATCSPSCRAWPARTRRRPGDAAAPRRGPRGRGGRDRPRAADADPGRPRRAARRRGRGRAPSSSTITPTYSGCPAMGEIMRATCGAGCSGRLRRRRRPHRARARLDAPTGSPPTGRRKLRRAGHRPAARRARAHRGPVPLTLGPARAGRLPALRLGGHRGPPRSARPRARRCAAAGACREPFEHVKEI